MYKTCWAWFQIQMFVMINKLNYPHFFTLNWLARCVADTVISKQHFDCTVG